MKIYHVISAKEWGGGEVYVMMLAKEQRRHGHQVEIICAKRPDITKHFKREGFKIHTMPIHGLMSKFSALRIAGMLLTDQTESAIHVHRINDTPLIADTLSLIPRDRRPRFLCTHHLIEPARSGKKFEKVYRMIDRIICVSEKAKKVFLSTFPANLRDKVVSILNSVNTATVSNAASQEKDGVNLTYVGRINHDKGVDTIIEALALIPEAGLTIIGTGNKDYVESLHRQAAEIGVADRINWVGFTSKVSEYIRNADIGLIPSRWEEPCALVNFEFLAAGIPMVTSDTGGQPEIISDGKEGFLVHPDDPEALAKTVQRIISDPQLRKTMGENARKTYERRFTYDNFYRQVMANYKRPESTRS